MNSKRDGLTGYPPTWCPGCGNWGILAAIKTTLLDLKLTPADLGVVFGIGCSGNMNDFLNGYAIHSLHGRAIPNAIGLKIANHRLPVMAIVGDGDCYGEGGNHLIHACRGNHDITVIVHNNRVYGLTTGQASPTSHRGYKSKSTPAGIIERALNPLLLALTQGATFVGQAFVAKPLQMTATLKKAILHHGFSLVNILQPCVSFNKVNTYQYYLKRVYELPKNYQKESLKRAITLAQEDYHRERYALGVIYESERSAYTDGLPQIRKKTLVEKKRFTDYQPLFSSFC